LTVLHVIDGLALSVDRAVLLDDRSFAPSSTHRATIDDEQLIQHCCTAQYCADQRMVIAVDSAALSIDRTALSVVRANSCVPPLTDRTANERSSSSASPLTDGANASVVHNNCVTLYNNVITLVWPYVPFLTSCMSCRFISIQIFLENSLICQFTQINRCLLT